MRKKNTLIAIFEILRQKKDNYNFHIWNMRIEIFNKSTLTSHSMIWLLFWSIELSFIYGRTGGNTPLGAILLNILFSTFFFYVCLLFVIFPFFKKNKLKALLLNILLILAFSGLKLLLEYSFETEYLKTIIQKTKSYRPYVFLDLYRFSTMSLYAFAYWYYLKSIQEEKQRRHTEEKLLKAEIDFLKAQINPHFVFNTLNFVYNDVTKTNPTSGDAILSLTKLMRYSVESTKSEHSTVEKELEAIGEYIHLQKIRFGESLALNYTQSGNLLFFTLPPLVLLSIIENAFKYGVHDDHSDPIVIDIKVSSQGLSFLCRNKKRMDFQDKETTAVGNKNIKRRLEMSHPENYTLNIHETVTHYEVRLNIIWKS